MSEPVNSGKVWTREEDVQIVTFLQARASGVEAWNGLGTLAHQLGRSVGAVEGRIVQIAFNIQKVINAIEILRKTSP